MIAIWLGSLSGSNFSFKLMVVKKGSQALAGLTKTKVRKLFIPFW
jgi:hypothetical protein